MAKFLLMLLSLQILFAFLSCSNFSDSKIKKFKMAISDKWNCTVEKSNYPGEICSLKFVSREDTSINLGYTIYNAPGTDSLLEIWEQRQNLISNPRMQYYFRYNDYLIINWQLASHCYKKAGNKYVNVCDPLANSIRHGFDSSKINFANRRIEEIIKSLPEFELLDQ